MQYIDSRPVHDNSRSLLNSIVALPQIIPKSNRSWKMMDMWQGLSSFLIFTSLSLCWQAPSWVDHIHKNIQEYALYHLMSGNVRACISADCQLRWSASESHHENWDMHTKSSRHCKLQDGPPAAIPFLKVKPLTGHIMISHALQIHEWHKWCCLSCPSSSAFRWHSTRTSAIDKQTDYLDLETS